MRNYARDACREAAAEVAFPAPCFPDVDFFLNCASFIMRGGAARDCAAPCGLCIAVASVILVSTVLCTRVAIKRVDSTSVLSLNINTISKKLAVDIFQRKSSSACRLRVTLTTPQACKHRSEGDSRIPRVGVFFVLVCELRQQVTLQLSLATNCGLYIRGQPLHEYVPYRGVE